MVDDGYAIHRNGGAYRQANKGRGIMAWKTPKIVEISVAMEINSYVCAEI